MTRKPEAIVDVPHMQEFPSYERLLWHMLATLARRGHFVPPDEGRDLIHDFFVEAWSGLRDRYEPSQGTFSAYVAGAFYRFARRRLVELEVWRSKLVDIDVALEQASDMPSPAELAESAEGVALVRSAFRALPGPQRQALLEFLDEAPLSERDIASHQGKSRHSVRRALADGVTNLCVAFAKAGLSDANLVKLAWHDGRVSEDIANRLNLSAHEVQLRRKQFASRLLAVLRAYRHSARRGVPTMPLSNIFKAVLLDDNRERAREQLKAHADSLREELAEPEDYDTRLSADELAVLEAHPERLGEFYDALFPEDDADASPESAAAAVARYEQDRTAELARAFEEMVIALPDGLKDWSHWFGTPTLSSAQVEYLLQRPAMAEAGEAAHSLVRYGLTPGIFAETFGGFAHHFKVKERHRAFEAHGGDRVCLALESSGDEIKVAYEDLLAQTQGTPGIPEVEGYPERMTGWTLEALNVLPYLVPGYCVTPREHQLPLVVRLPKPGMTLSARWSRRASEMAARARFRLIK